MKRRRRDGPNDDGGMVADGHRDSDPWSSEREAVNPNLLTFFAQLL
jgi:hypothetical protein